MNEEQLDRYDNLIRTPDLDLYDWIIGRKPVPLEFGNDVMKLLQKFKYHLEQNRPRSL